jgi:hypothetical protein
MIRRLAAPALAALTLATTAAMPLAAGAAPSPKGLERNVALVPVVCLIELPPGWCLIAFDNWIQKFFP